MPSLNLRNVLRRNPDRPSLRDRAAALKVAARLVIRPPKSGAVSAAPAMEAGAILDRVLIFRVQELVAIEASQDTTLRATSCPDAYDSPDWVRMEGDREKILAQVVATRAHTMPGLKAKASLLDLESVRNFQEPFERLSRSIAADVAALTILPRSEQTAPAPDHVDPHVTLLPALRQAFAWTRAAHPLGEHPPGSPEDRAFTAVMNHCWGLARQIVALPPPATLPGLGALALALSVHTEEAIGRPQDDGMDDQRYPEERRLVAAIRAMMAVSGVEPLPGWVGFEVGPDSDAGWEAVKAQAGKGSAPAWALAGKSGPDDEVAASKDAPDAAGAAEAHSASSPLLDLSGCSVRQIARLHEALNAVAGHVSSLSQLPCFWNGNEDMRHYEYNPAGKIIDREADRLAELAQLCADEIAQREPQSEPEADDALMIRLQQELIGNGRIHDPALIRDITTTWGA